MKFKLKGWQIGAGIGTLWYIVLFLLFRYQGSQLAQLILSIPLIPLSYLLMLVPINSGNILLAVTFIYMLLSGALIGFGVTRKSKAVKIASIIVPLLSFLYGLYIVLMYYGMV